MAYWLVKSDPETYGLADLERDRQTTWDGVANALAQKHLRAVKKGDGVLVYHSGADKAIVGIARAASDAYPDPRARDPKAAVFDLEFGRRVTKPVTLAAIKADSSFADFALVRMSRLSVMPVPDSLWKRLLKMAGES
jgi:predicted RNA-binding protein with PUA-like domain